MIIKIPPYYPEKSEISEYLQKDLWYWMHEVVTALSDVNEDAVATIPIQQIDGNTGEVFPVNGVVNIVGGTGVTTSATPNGGNTLTINVSPLAAFKWNSISTSQTMVSDNGYICQGGGTLSLLLPPISAFGDEIEIALDGSTGFTVTQGAGQSIKFGMDVTTTGVGGSLSSTSQGDTLRMVCDQANLRWVILSSMGNLTVV